MHVPEITPAWLVALVNGYGTQPRRVADEPDRVHPDLGEVGEGPDVAEVRSDELTEVADRLWPVFAAPDPQERARLLGRLLGAARLTPTVDAQGRSWWDTAHSAAAPLVTAGCTATLLGAVSRGGWSRLGTCDGEDCADVYLDTSGRSRRYCSPTCLNRARVRAYRARQRA